MRCLFLNAAVRLLTNAGKKHKRVTLVLGSLHWLPVHSRIQNPTNSGQSLSLLVVKLTFLKQLLIQPNIFIFFILHVQSKLYIT